MSSLVTAPEGAPVRSVRDRRAVPRIAPSLDQALAGAVAAAAVALAFATSGGVALSSNTWTEIVLILAGASVAAVTIVVRPRGPAWGLAVAALFGGVVTLTALSIAWSVNPDTSWVESGRTAAYFAAFGGAVALARVAPARWPAVVGAVALAATALSAWAVLVKVFSWPIDGQNDLGRLLAPFDYWNATGLGAALGIAPLLWLGGRRGPGRRARALATPGLALLFTVIVLSYSRSALIAGIAAAAVFLAFARTRLRSTLMLALGAGGAAVICAWALSTPALTNDRVASGARSSAGHSFGVVLVVVLIALTGAGLVAAYAADRSSMSTFTRRRIGAGLIGLVALVPVLAIVAMAASSRGLIDEVTHVWSTLTSASQRVGDTPTRLVDLGNTRPRYWRQGISVGEHHLLAGAGAGGFGTAYTRYATARLTTNPVGHAHSYVIETFADFGLIGLLLNAALLLSWGLASARTVGWWRGDHQNRATGTTSVAARIERDGMWALLGVVVAFGVSSAIDWTWFYPGVTVPALVCAGWVAGRRRLGRAAVRPAGRAPLAARPLAILALTGLVGVTLAAAWAVWQPLRSADAISAGINAATAGNASAALADGRSAVAYDPDSLQAREELWSIYRALGEKHLAKTELLAAVQTQPQNPLPWTWLGQYELTLHQPQRALHALLIAQSLDITNTSLAPEIAQARTEAHT